MITNQTKADTSAADNASLPLYLRQRVEALLASSTSGKASARRKILGIVGPPGSGKSTLAAQLQAAFPEVSQVVPMDGFHLANAELVRLGRAARKGAPDTFDSAGYVALLHRLRQPPIDDIDDMEGGPIIYAPEFLREIEEPVAGAIAIQAHTRLIITEGNYLLLKQGAWAGVAPLLDECWYLQVDDALRKARLIKRHEQFGRSAAAARAWVEATDEPNARLIETTSGYATIKVQL